MIISAVLMLALPAFEPEGLFADGFDPACYIIASSPITYGIYPEPYRPNQDLGEWANIWGAASASGSVQEWPGPLAASPVIRNFDRYGCVAAKFHVPAGFPSTKFGQFVHGINPPGPPIDAAYSTRPGDFGTTLGPGCAVRNWHDDLSTGMRWKIDSTNPSFCGLHADTDYYMNIRLSDPDTIEDQCGAAPVCSVYLQHTHN